MRKVCFLLLLVTASIQGWAQQTYSFRNGDLELYYEVKGQGAPLYILTGGPGMPPYEPGHRFMDSLQEHFTVVLPHQRGTGKSKLQKCDSSTINIEAFISDINKLMQVRGDQKITLLGISWGGFLAQAFAAAYPAKVDKLLLLCAAPPSYKLWPVMEANQFSRYSKGEKDSLALLRSIFEKRTVEELERFKQTQPAAKELQAFYHFIRIVHRNHFYNRLRIEKNFDQIMKDFNFQLIPLIDKEIIEKKWDITSALKKTTIPALIIYGRQDDQGESSFYLQKNCLANSQMVVLEECGHVMWEEQPGLLFREIAKYLQL